MWKPFIKHLLENISNDITLILFGNPAKKIKEEFTPTQNCIELEHPYNVSFINSKSAYELFESMRLLDK
jgi:uracil DNA glycosylase